MNTRFPILSSRNLCFVFLTVFAFSKGSYAQEKPVVINPAAYQKAVNAEFTKYGASRYLYDHADAYQRLIQFHALKRMGIDLSSTEAEADIIPESVAADTTIVKDVSSLGVSDQNETTIAINRGNSNIIVVGANDIPTMISAGMPAYYTSNGGMNWATARVPRPGSSYQVLGDPAIIASDSGNFYYAYLVGDQNTNFDNVVVATSKDGKKWTNGPLIVPLDSVSGFEDKENICVDNNPSSPYYGRVYVVWVHFLGNSIADGGSGKISWSDDKGKTWSIPNDFVDSVIMFSQIRIGKNGEIFISFSLSKDYDDTQSDDYNAAGTHNFLLSVDGGKSFQNSTLTDFILYPRRNNGFIDDHRPALKGVEGFRAYPYITHDVDLQTNMIHLVYGTWYSSSVDTAAAALFYIRSSDLGKTWTTPAAVGISNPLFNTLDHDRFCPWVSVNQRTGDAYCMYYSSERDPNNALIGAFRTKLTGDLKEFPIPLEASDFDPILLTKSQGAPFIGDYQGGDAFDSVYAVSWTGGTGRDDGDVFVSIQAPNHPVNSVSVIIHSSNIWLSAPSPNPVSNGTISFSYYLPHQGIIEIALYSDAGLKIRTVDAERLEAGTYSQKYSLGGLSSGSYILRLSTPYSSAQRNVVVTK